MIEIQKEIFSLPLPPGNLGLPFLGETISFFTDRNFNQKRQAFTIPILNAKRGLSALPTW